MQSLRLSGLAARKNLSKLIRFFIYFLAISIFLGSTLHQIRTKNLTNKNEFILKWLKGEIAEDRSFTSILIDLSDQLRILSDIVISPETKNYKAEIVESDNFTSRSKSLNKYQFISRINNNSNPVLTNYAFIEFQKVKINKNSSINEDNTSANEDKDKFAKSFGLIVSSMEKSGSNISSFKEFSNTLIDYFGIDSMLEKYPSVKIKSIFIVNLSDGNFALYPADDISFQGFVLNEREWYKSSIIDYKLSEQINNNNINNNNNVGLSPVYGDFATKEFTRTLWYKFKDNNQKQYLIGLDLILIPPEEAKSPSLLKSLFYERKTLIGILLQSILISLVVSLLILFLCWLFIKTFKIQSQEIAKLIIFNKSQDDQLSYFVSPVRKIKSLSEDNIDLTNQYSIQNAQTRSSGLSINPFSSNSIAAMNLNFVRMRAEEMQFILRETTNFKISPDEKYRIRGKEFWTIYQQKHNTGHCRFCGQPSLSQTGGLLEQIGGVIINHEMSENPSIRLKRRDGIFPSQSEKFLQENIKWHILKNDNFIFNQEFYPLELYTLPKLPDYLLENDDIKSFINKYKSLNEGRFITNDLLNIAYSILAKNTNECAVKSNYKTDFIDSIISTSIGANFLNSQPQFNRQRIILAQNPQTNQSFWQNPNNINYAQSFFDSDHVAVQENDELKTLASDLRSQVNFAIVTFRDNSEIVIVHDQETDYSSGYITWRNADIDFYNKVFEIIFNKATKLEEYLRSI